MTIMCDGWIGPTRQSIINFMVYCDGITMFLKSLEASKFIKDYKYIGALLEDVIQEVGEENVVQIVTDNGSNFKKAGKKLIEKHNLFWTSCAVHCIDLMLKDMGKLETIRKAMGDVRTVTNFIYNHGYVLAMMRERCGGDIMWPSVICFATNYITLQSILNKKTGLKQLFTSSQWSNYRESDSSTGRLVESIACNHSFWDRCRMVVNILELVVRVLRMVDGDKKPTMGYIYESIRLMKEAIKAFVPRGHKGYIKIINARWTKMLIHPLHLASKLFYFS